jgi:hypothetical protein
MNERAVLYANENMVLETQTFNEWIKKVKAMP